MCTSAARKALALRTTVPMLRSLTQFSMATWNGWRRRSRSSTIASSRQYRYRSTTLRWSPPASSSGSSRGSSGQGSGCGPTPGPAGSVTPTRSVRDFVHHAHADPHRSCSGGLVAGGGLGLGGGGAAVGGGGQAELGPDLGEPGLGLGVGGRLLHLEHPSLDRRALQLGGPLGLRVAGLDLVPHLVEGGDVLADRLRQGRHRPVDLLLHLRLVQLREQLLALGQLLLQLAGVLLDRGLGLVGGLR